MITRLYLLHIKIIPKQLIRKRRLEALGLQEKLLLFSADITPSAALKD